MLLILAGVSIAMLTGENGILNQATNAKEKTIEAEDKEKIQIAINESQISNSGYQKLTEENLQKEIDEQFETGEVRVYANEKNAFSFIFQNKESNYRLEKDGTLNKIDIALKINNVEEFRNFMNEVNSGNTYEGQYVYLLENIDLENQEWDVIGSYTDGTTNKPFAGIFEGNNRTISGLNINKSQDSVGLFAYNTGIIRDIVLENGSVTGNRRTGGVVGVNEGVIENCANFLNITSKTSGYVGGISGINTEKISNSYNCGIIEAVFDSGGISGGNNEGATIEYCYNSGKIIGSGGEVNGDGRTHSGGIAGNSSGNIYSCYNAGDIEIANLDGGGIVGTILLNGEISNCYNVGEIYGNGATIGNVIGAAYHKTTIINCYFSREICSLNGVGQFGTPTISNGTIERTVNYMKTSNFVNDLNKDEEAFTISTDLNDGYPVLIWQCE